MTTKKTAKKTTAKKAERGAKSVADVAEEAAKKKSAKTSVAKEAEEFDDLVKEFGPPVDVDDMLPVPEENVAQDVLDKGGSGHGDPDVDDNFVRTALGAVKWGWGVVKSNDDQYEGLCARYVRRCFHVAPLAPSAIAMWEMAERKWRTSDPTVAPRGHAVFWRGGDFGHVALSVGDGMCLSTDIRDRGQANLCRIAAIGEAWGYEFLGWTKDVNGEQAPRKVQGPRVSDLEWRIRFLRQAVSRARAAGLESRTKHLAEWLRLLRDRADGD